MGRSHPGSRGPIRTLFLVNDINVGDHVEGEKMVAPLLSDLRAAIGRLAWLGKNLHLHLVAGGYIDNVEGVSLLNSLDCTRNGNAPQVLSIAERGDPFVTLLSVEPAHSVHFVFHAESL